MDIEVRLFAALQQGRFRRKKMAFSDGSTTADVCGRLAINPDEVSILLVNGVAAPRDRALKAEDVVSLFPAIGGG